MKIENALDLLLTGFKCYVHKEWKLSLNSVSRVSGFVFLDSVSKGQHHTTAERELKSD
jgi:general stress protein CsbA